MEQKLKAANSHNPPVKPALQPEAHKLFDDGTGKRDEKEKAEKVGKEAGSEEKHTSDEDQRTVQEFPGGKASLRQFGLDTTDNGKTLRADQPSACETDGKHQSHGRNSADQASHLDDGFIGSVRGALVVSAKERFDSCCQFAGRYRFLDVVICAHLEPDDLEAHQHKLEAKYKLAQQLEPRHELYETEGAEILLVGYGIASRVLRSAVEECRRQGVKVGLFRPITVWPFPAKALQEAAAEVQKVLVVELSNGQMVEDVRLTLNGKVPVEFYGRVGGNVPSVEEVQGEVLSRANALV